MIAIEATPARKGTFGHRIRHDSPGRVGLATRTRSPLLSKSSADRIVDRDDLSRYDRSRIGRRSSVISILDRVEFPALSRFEVLGRRAS
jgi:hypothetical protein